MQIHPVLHFCLLFFIPCSASPSAGNVVPTSISDTIKLILGFGGPYLTANVVIVVITLINIIVYKLLEHQDDNSDSDQKSGLSVNLNLSFDKKLCRFFSLDEILSATYNFDESLVIGKGGFGKVYKGLVDNGSCNVAIKRLNPLSKQGASEFWSEIKLLSKFRHSHLVCLIGYCDQNNEMILVYEFMFHGSLDNHLHKISKNDESVILSWVQRLKICIGAARGLDYLHTGTAVVERVIHRDVKSSNILLDENWAAKISDFGLSRIGPADQESTHVSTKHIQGTLGYMDPEYFQTRRFTRKSDVYAFGVVLLEVLSERPAVDRSLVDEDQWSLAGWGKHCINEGTPHKLIGLNVNWEILPNSLTEFVQIAAQCLHSRPQKRPTMSEVVAKLELALSLQLRTNELMDDDLHFTDWPLGSPESKDLVHPKTPVVSEHLILGLLRIKVHRGINLAVRDIRSSDPYVFVRMGKQKLRTRVVKKNINPEWNEDLTFAIADTNIPIKLQVYNSNTFSVDDKMGDVEVDIKPFVEAVKMHLENLPSGTIITAVKPSRQNWLAEESKVVWVNDRVTQHMILRLRNVECGEVELQLMWIDIPGLRGI